METVSYSRAVSPSNILDADHDRLDDGGLEPGIAASLRARLEARAAAALDAAAQWKR